MEHPLVPQVLLQHGQFVRALAHELLRDAHAAEDVAQETWARYFQRPPVGDRGLRSWFRTVVRNQAVNAGRSASRRAARERRAARLEAVDGAGPELEQSELLRAVVEAVLALEEPYRGTILARYWRGLDATELAAECGASAATVRSREQLALEQLRRRLDGRSRGERAAWAAVLARIAGPQEVASESGPMVERATKAVRLAGILGTVITFAVVLRWIGSSAGGREEDALVASSPPEAPKSTTQVDPVESPAKADVSSSTREALAATSAGSRVSAILTYPIEGELRHSRDGRAMSRVILAFHNDARSPDDPEPQPVEVETDDEGHFSVALPEGIFRAEIPGSPDSSFYPKIEPFFSIPRESKELELRHMDPDAWLEVQVLADGSPFANAEIEGYIKTHFGAMALTSKSDQSGRVKFGYPKTGPGTQLGLVAFGHARELVSIPATVSQRPPDEPLVLELAPAGHLIVHAKSASGEPVRDCDIEVTYEGEPKWLLWPGWYTSRTNALGIGVLGLPAGHYTVSLRDPASGEFEKEVDLDWESETNLDFQLPDVPLAVSGFVVDEQGAPLADVHLEVGYPEDSIYEDWYLGNPTTDSDGSFAFRMAGSGVLRVTTAKDLLGDRFEPSVVDVPFGTRDVLFRRVDSRPLATLQVEIVVANSSEHPKFVQPALFRPPTNHSYGRPLYGGLGTIDVKGYTDLSVEFRAIGFRTRTIPVLDLLAGKGIQRVALEPGFEGNVLVLDQDGDHPPIPGARVMDGDVCLATADANGRIVLDLDHWPDEFLFTATGYGSEKWGQEHWLRFYAQPAVWLVRSDSEKDH